MRIRILKLICSIHIYPISFFFLVLISGILQPPLFRSTSGLDFSDSRRSLNKLSFTPVHKGMIADIPIYIDGNDNFVNQAWMNGWPGDGTYVSPYIIEEINLPIAFVYGIAILNTNVHFEISNCIINGGSEGIHVRNVSNGYISGNTITNATQSGIWALNSRDCTVSNNSITDCGDGISIDNSSNLTLEDNLVTSNIADGINLHFSHYSVVIDNSITNNSHTGLNVDESENNILYGNIVMNNSYYGITLEHGTRNNTISNHYFGGNNGGNCQATDNGISNIIEYNYWDDWLRPDSDKDGIVDSPYEIDGTANNRDLYPITLSPPSKTPPKPINVKWGILILFIICGLLILMRIRKK
ncbi:MAG: right-handed parallel beta-helix repeat-containing protein [Candidatus Hodarchaeales archaeon]